MWIYIGSQSLWLVIKLNIKLIWRQIMGKCTSFKKIHSWMKFSVKANHHLHDAAVTTKFYINGFNILDHTFRDYNGTRGVSGQSILAVSEDHILSSRRLINSYISH